MQDKNRITCDQQKPKWRFSLKLYWSWFYQFLSTFS